MKASKMLIPTLKEAPSEAIIDSHIYMLRAGLIKKLVAGVYTFLPMGLRVLQKIENIIREEMNASGAQEILSSAIQPKELWEESGRWQKYGPELFRFKDRHDREFCLGPTHEEIFTDLVRSMVQSYKSLPLNIYQIQSKYRDEMRPRFGLMRGREFIMKDAYSFDVDQKASELSYQNMYETYERIFTRLGLNYKVVLADTGAIGGSVSHQFMALSDVGESNILYCENCSYAADEEKATSSFEEEKIEEWKELSLEETPNTKTCEEVAKFFHVPLRKVFKSMVYYDEQSKEYAMFIVRGDSDINPVAVINVFHSSEAFVRLAREEELLKLGLYEGYIGPKDVKIKVYLDASVTKISNGIMGVNKEGYHYCNVNFSRDFQGEIRDLHIAKAGELCPRCGKPLKSERGIEVGQLFQLGSKYSLPMQCTFLNSEGKLSPMIMGCYGIGVTRTFAAIVEQHHDANGICFPFEVAPYPCVILPVSYEDPIQKEVADLLYEELKKIHPDVIIDDRDLKAGFKFKDWDLIGIPYQIIVGRNAINRIVEFKKRKENSKEELSVEEVIKKAKEFLKDK